jgi:uncharacterized membrane protein YdbT with pleckstrin-like domain
MNPIITILIAVAFCLVVAVLFIIIIGRGFMLKFWGKKEDNQSQLPIGYGDSWFI